MAQGRKIVGIRPTGTAHAVDGDNIAAEVAAPAGIDPPEPDAAVAADAQSVATDAASVIEPVAYDDAPWLPHESALPESGGVPWMAMFLSLCAIAWAAFVGWTQTGGFSALPGIAQWPMIALLVCGPIAVLLLGTLLIERSSERTTRRHLFVLARLREEQTLLADRLSIIDRHWRDTQAALDGRAAQLDASARSVAQSVTEAGSVLDDHMHKTVIQAATVNQQGEAAKRAMEALLVALPKIEDVAQRAATAMRETGQLAYQYGGQLEEKIASVRHESGEAVDRMADANATLVDGLRKLEAAATTAQSAAEAAGARFGEIVTEQHDAAMATSSAIATAMATNTSDADALNATLVAASVSGAAVHGAVAQAVTAVEAQLADLNGQLDTHMATAHARVTALEAAIAQLSLSGAAGASAAEDFATRADTVVATLANVRQEISDALPAAVERLQTIVSASQEQIDALPDRVGSAHQAADAVLEQLRLSETSLTSQLSLVAQLEQQAAAALQAQDDAAARIRGALDTLSEQLRVVAERDAANVAASLETIDQSARTIVSDTADQLQQALADALDKATGVAVTERLAAVATASDQAVAAASAASDRLMRELITIADSSAALEARAAQVSTVLEGGKRDTLARQLALLTESLQSSAVDLVRILASDVADQAWDAYLKGDRSIFARRAMRLLTNAEAKELLTRYERDDEFRALVNRYVHDFEAMLRSTIDTRDGSAIAVTLLSSDVGKIYVALAQAIERLRS